jgi:hypothetical protein
VPDVSAMWSSDYSPVAHLHIRYFANRSDAARPAHECLSYAEKKRPRGFFRNHVDVAQSVCQCLLTYVVDAGRCPRRKGGGIYVKRTVCSVRCRPYIPAPSSPELPPSSSGRMERSFQHSASTFASHLPGTVIRVETHASHRKQRIECMLARNVSVHVPVPYRRSILSENLAAGRRYQ